MLFRDALVSDDIAHIELNLDLVLGFPDLHATTDPGHGHRVAVAVQGHIAFNVHRIITTPATELSSVFVQVKSVLASKSG